jgi:NAD(P)-dependent dehydrogenase (short-subunit alcohol dehydrogenase family)
LYSVTNRQYSWFSSAKIQTACIPCSVFRIPSEYENEYGAGRGPGFSFALREPMKLQNIVTVVTGASQGLGRAIAEEFVREGAHVAICARDSTLLETVRSQLEELAASDQHILAHAGDVSSKDQMDELFRRTEQEIGLVDVLVNNAGVYGPKGPSESVDLDEWSRALEINLLGTFIPTRFAVAQMKKKGGGKIINLSGGGATNPLPRLSAYAASKAAVVRLTETLAEELRGSSIAINAIAPGALNTRFLDEVLQAGPEVVGSGFYEKALKQRETGGAPLEKGVALCVYLASSAGDGITGKLISALWDPWEKLDNFQAELASTDIYTLRRIVPEDRGKTF